jgi:hypothetical protein
VCATTGRALHRSAALAYWAFTVDDRQQSREAHSNSSFIEQQPEVLGDIRPWPLAALPPGGSAPAAMAALTLRATTIAAPNLARSRGPFRCAASAPVREQSSSIAWPSNNHQNSLETFNGSTVATIKIHTHGRGLGVHELGAMRGRRR